ncbi:MAG TPA: bacillithiol system redox-active protein YtxJ [Planctomycetota bacterium]|nr:bacillithiol system redox-active protein YtxJ [Planctomycetota bacterium]
MKTLASLEDLDALLAERGKPVVLFKHSTRCPVSAMAEEEFRDLVRARPSDAVYGFLDLLAHRDVSDAVARRLGVPHESPQAIVLRDGRVSAVLNHDEIRADALGRLLAP